MVTENLVNFGSGNGLLPDGRHQANTWTNVDLSSVRSSDNLLKIIPPERPQPSINKSCWKLNYLSKISFKSPRGHWVNIDCLTYLSIGFKESSSASFENSWLRIPGHKIFTQLVIKRMLAVLCLIIGYKYYNVVGYSSTTRPGISLIW